MIFFPKTHKSDMNLIMHINGLHYYDTERQDVALVETVGYNCEVYSKRQFQNYKYSATALFQVCKNIHLWF